MIHPTADMASDAVIGEGTTIWHHSHIREGVVIGRHCIVGKDVYIDAGVKIGDNVKIQNSALIYHGVTIDDGVFIGPQACLTNDLHPRAITPTGALKSTDDWVAGKIHVCHGASIGAGAIVLPNLVIGRFAMVAAGAVVTRDVPDHALALGVPARLVGYVCRCGQALHQRSDSLWECPECGWSSESLRE